jgi:hypothetical protein
VASYDFSVVSWDVQTTMHFAEKNSAYDPFDVQILTLQTDLRSFLSHNPAVIPAEDAGRFPPWHAEADPRVYLFPYPYAAVVEFFGMTGAASTDAVSLFWQEARVPVFGSLPEDWDKLSEVVEKVGVPGVTFGTIVVGLHDEPVILLLALVGVTVIVRIVDPVASAVGTGLAQKIRRAFGMPAGRATRRRRASERPAAPRRTDG